MSTEKEFEYTEEEKYFNEVEDTIGKYEADVTGAMDALDKGLTDYNNKLDQGLAAAQKAQNAQTQYTIDEIERQKQLAEKDYSKEQKAAYVDYQQQVNPYGANAEAMAAAGLTGSGYSETSKVAMYNQWQNRVATARESLARSVDTFNANIAQAKAQNSIALAQLALETFTKQTEFAASIMLKKNDLLASLASDKAAMRQNANDKWLAMLDSMSTENSADLPIDTYVDLPFNDTATVPKFSKMRTFNNVRDYLKEIGVDNDGVGELMTRAEWRENKDKYKKYKTYDEYLIAVLNYYENDYVDSEE